MYPDFMNGIKRIWEFDSISQDHYLSYLSEKVRKLPYSLLKDFNAFMVPNDGYLREYFGERCLSPEYEIYDYDGYCRLTGCIVFPCLTLLGECIGWIAFNPFKKAEAQDTGIYLESYYSYPSKRIFDKGSYLYVRPDIFRRALSDNYLILTDGVFDSLHLVHCGFNAASLLGSYLNDRSSFLLRFISQVYVSVDNDEAGLKMYESVRKLIPHAKYIKQGLSKDVDDILKIDINDKFKNQLREAISSHTHLVLR